MNNQIDNAIDRWFRETETAFNNVNMDSPVDYLCRSAIALSHNYCSAVLLLLNNGYKLPAMALLRTLAELFIRLTWCLSSDNQQNESQEVRIKRWTKRSLEKRRTFIKDMIDNSISSAEEIKGYKTELKKLEQMISKIQYKSLPPLFKLLSDFNDKLQKCFEKDVYPNFYSVFNAAIHPDILLFDYLAVQNANSNTVMWDIKEKTAVLKSYCLDIAFYIVGRIRQNYKWDYNAIKAEHLKIKKDFPEERKEEKEDKPL